MNRLQSLLSNYRRRRALRSIRASFAAFGWPLDMTDEEIEEACSSAGEFFRHAGVTSEEAARNFREAVAADRMQF